MEKAGKVVKSHLVDKSGVAFTSVLADCPNMIQEKKNFMLYTEFQSPIMPGRFCNTYLTLCSAKIHFIPVKDIKSLLLLSSSPWLWCSRNLLPSFGVKIATLRTKLVFPSFPLQLFITSDVKFNLTDMCRAVRLSSLLNYGQRTRSKFFWKLTFGSLRPFGVSETDWGATSGWGEPPTCSGARCSSPGRGSLSTS